MKRVRIFLIGLMLGLLSSNFSYAQKTKFQSIFIYNFSKYIKWPDDFNKGKFVIGVLGNSELLKDLESMAAAKKETNGLIIEVINFKDINSMTDSNLLFIPEKMCNRIDAIHSSIGNKPTLIVTDKKGMAQSGAVINFIEVGSKIKFELNKSAADKLGLVISGSLTNLAILV